MSTMAVSLLSIANNPISKDIGFQGNFSSEKPISRWRERLVIRCCRTNCLGGEREGRNYYELLGVSADSNAKQIKEAYRKLQKKHHPDIAGQQGHEYTLKLNEAYKVLMRENLRREYDSSIGQIQLQFRTYSPDIGYSSWKGPIRPQALFVDENACIGCRECVSHAKNTLVMDESIGCARVKVQYGDTDKKIEVAVDSCPVNCIYWVEREELAMLEYMIQPQPKEGYGVFGGGWERPANVFMAAKAFTKQLKRQEATEQSNRYASVDVEEETPAQAKARDNASMKIKMEQFKGVWDWVKRSLWQNHVE